MVDLCIVLVLFFVASLFGRVVSRTPFRIYFV